MTENPVSAAEADLFAAHPPGGPHGSERLAAADLGLEFASTLLDAAPRAMSWIRTTMRDAMKGELTVPQFRTLVHLVKRGPMTNGALAERQGVSVAAMSRMVETLARKGLVGREASAVDRRALVIAATEEGLRLYGKSRTAVQHLLREKFIRLPAADQAGLVRGAALISVMFS